MRVIVKQPHEAVGHELEIDNDLGDFQQLVGGYIEAVTMDSGVVLIINEKGRLLGMDANICINGHYLVGPVVVVGTDGEDFTDCTLTIDEWEKIIKEWGN